MNTRAFILMSFLVAVITGCAQYTSPARNTWPTYLRGASLDSMTETARIAKRPVYLGAGGKLITSENVNQNMEYGDKATNDNIVAVQYMAKLEYELYDSLRKPGISVQRAGTDVVIILVRDAIMKLDVADISADGADTLKTISKILKQYDSTFVELAGYTDAMKNTTAENSLSMDMASRVAVFLSQNDINTARMFIVARGASRPIAAQDDIGRLTNRRVEIRIAPAR